MQIFAIEFNYPLDYHQPKDNENNTYRKFLNEAHGIDIPKSISQIRILNLIPDEVLPFHQRLDVSLIYKPFPFDYSTVSQFLIGLGLNNNPNFWKQCLNGDLFIVYGHGYDGKLVGQQISNGIYVNEGKKGYERPLTIHEITKGSTDYPFDLSTPEHVLTEIQKVDNGKHIEKAKKIIPIAEIAESNNLQQSRIFKQRISLYAIGIIYTQETMKIKFNLQVFA